MKLVISDKIIEKYGLSINELLYLISIYYGLDINKETFNSICSKGFVSYDSIGFDNVPNNLKLTTSGTEILESILLDSEFKEEVEEDRFDILAEELRNLYPKGRKPGTAYMWRDSKNIIAKRLRALVKKYDISFTNEQAIEATRKYIESFNGDYRYMQLLKYFISKPNLVDGHWEDSSQLLSYIENNGQSDTNSEWTGTIR